MATRSKAKTVAAADSKPAVQHPTAKHAKTETTPPGDESKATTTKTKSTKPAPKRGKTKPESELKNEICICSQDDNGTPMVLCGECQIWFHFSCVNLAESDAEDITYYVCPSCAQSTGLRTIRSWEGECAVEKRDVSSVFVADKGTKPVKLAKPVPVKKAVIDESDEEESSEDEYVARDRTARAKRRRAAVASDSESNGSDSDARQGRKRRLKKASASPAPSRLDRKRKASPSEGPTGLKRNKPNVYNPHEDPTRKYCLGKLEELFRDIFFRYPHVKVADSEAFVSKPVEEMTEEEKEALVQESKQFAGDLEKAIFETYAEHDKSGGVSSAGINYKDRFRTLQFNLSKPDRVVIHQRITSRDITPKDLSLMSSTDLANEETKQLIKIAEEEALAHSIIPKVVAPRAKMTHKGFEDIEFDGERMVTSAPDPEAERRKEIEEEERRERERNARLRGRTASISVPPESPIVPQNPASWGAPPPVPLHAQHAALQEKPLLGPEVATEPQEPELQLGDLINIDEEPTPSTDTIPTPTDQHTQEVDPFGQTQTIATEHVQILEPSPFTPTVPEKPTFDLGALWSGPAPEEKPEEEDTTSDGEAPMIMSPAPISPPTLKDDDSKDILGSGEPDFDMLFEEQEGAPPAPAPPVTIETMAVVWTGKLSMPLDSTLSQETPMTAKQIAGPAPLDADSPLWKTLFPSDHLRIDGRVQTKKSSEYLTSMRFDQRRELYAVLFSPATEQDEGSFKALSDFLVQKDRHGLVFPWTQRPKEHHPGKEFYIIPLRADEPIPEYMELMDNLKIPKQRQRNYFVGIWVLNKGKLAPPTPPPSVAAAASLSPPALNAPTYIPSFSATPPVNVTPVPPAAVPTIIPSVPPLPGPSTPLQAPPTPIAPTSVNPVAALLSPVGSLPPGVDPKGLAAEVAALTPDQIQTLLRSLQGAVQTPPTQVTQQSADSRFPPLGARTGVPPSYPPYVSGPSAPPPSYDYPPHPAPPVPSVAGQPWAAGPGGSRSPYPQPPQYPPFGEPPRIPGYTSPPQDRYPPGDHSGPYHSRGGNRDRGRSGGRGRGRKSYHATNREPPRTPLDSGWPRKQPQPPDNQGRYDEGRRW